MGLYNDLTEGQKSIVEPWTNNFRAWVGELARELMVGRALQASYQATNGTGDIIGTLDVGETVPNTGGLPGAQPLLDTDMVALVAGLDAFITTYDTVATRQRMAQAAGPLAGL